MFLGWVVREHVDRLQDSTHMLLHSSYMQSRAKKLPRARDFSLPTLPQRQPPPPSTQEARPFVIREMEHETLHKMILPAYTLLQFVSKFIGTSWSRLRISLLCISWISRGSQGFPWVPMGSQGFPGGPLTPGNPWEPLKIPWEPLEIPFEFP